MSWRSEPGFSLLELILVLAIMALGFTFVAPNFARSLDGLRFRAAAREVADALRQARGIALSQGREAVFFLDVTGHRYRIDRQRKFHSLPEFVELTLETAESETNDSGGNIRFFPDGSATGGRVTLTWGERQRWVDVNWLTGRVTVSAMTDEN